MSSAEARIRRWREDPRTFVRECLGATPDPWQDDFLLAFTRNQRLALKACKGPGKSTALAWVGWNFLVTRPHPKVVATSITGDNLRDGLWTEMAKWQAKAPLLKERFSWGAERIVCVDHPETWWMSARQWSHSADASQQANTLAGIHSDYVLMLMDESGGIPLGVMVAAEAALATGKETKLVQAGNPTHLEGPLYVACTRERNLWFVMEISSDPDDPKRTPRVPAQWAREQIEKYGRDNPWVRVNVFGEFPPGQSNALLGVEDAVAASRRVIHPSHYADEVKVLGVDVARFGDDRTVLFPRQGMVAFTPRVLRNVDTMTVAGQVAQTITEWQPDAVFVDQTGIGAGVVDRLRQLGFAVIGVDNASRPLSTETKFLNRRAEMWWNLSRWVREGGCIPDDGELVSELTGPTYTYNAQGKLVLESKDQMKQRGLASPDKADALALTFAAPVATRSLRMLMAGHNAKASTDYDPYQVVN